MKLKPNSREAEVKKISEKEYVVKVKSPAREGRANEELIDLLSDFLRISKSNIEITSGFKSRKKIIYINEFQNL